MFNTHFQHGENHCSVLHRQSVLMTVCTQKVSIQLVLRQYIDSQYLDSWYFDSQNAVGT